MNIRPCKLAWCFAVVLLASGYFAEADIYMNFDSVDASISNVDATAYLASFGVTLTNVNPAGTVIIQNRLNSAHVTASSPPNFLLQNVAGSPNGISYTLTFNIPYGEVTFTRCSIGPQAESAAWAANAFSGSTEVASAGDPHIGRDSNTPAVIYSLYGPTGITSLIIAADGGNASAISSVPLDDFHLIPVAITEEPTNMNAVAGTTFIASVTAVGGGTLSYQWQFDSTNLTDSETVVGSQSNMLAVSDITPANAGNYQVIVTNIYGCATSSVAMLTLASQLTIFPSAFPTGVVRQAYSVTCSACCGKPPYTFTVTAGNLPPGLFLSTNGLISGLPTVPGTFPFSLQVADSDGITGNGAYVITINSGWAEMTPLPDGYQEHCLVYANGFLYNIGGVSDSNSEADGYHVFYSQVYGNGTIGPWNDATPLPEAVFDSAAVAANGYIYVLGGNHYTQATGDYTSDIVYYSKINSDGSLGTWQVANPLPYEVYFLSAGAWKSTIYSVGGEGDGGEVNNVYSANIQDDGSLTAWVAQPSFPYSIFGQCSVANGNLYVLAGSINQGADITSNVYYSKINIDGSLAGWNQTASLPQALSNYGAAAANGYFFTMAGICNSGLTSAFYFAPIAGDGTLRSWSSGTPLPQGLNENAAAASTSYIFESGGDNFSDAIATVYSLPLPPPPGMPALTALVTNQAVQLQLISSTNTGFGILASPDLVNWMNIGWGFTGTNGLLTFQDTNAANFPYRFYRAYWPLP